VGVYLRSAHRTVEGAGKSVWWRTVDRVRHRGAWISFVIDLRHWDEWDWYGFRIDAEFGLWIDTKFRFWLESDFGYWHVVAYDTHYTATAVVIST